MLMQSFLGLDRFGDAVGVNYRGKAAY